MSKITVWLTSYNHERFIEQSIKSILSQTYTDFELFIIDDCSTDNSWKIIRKYEKIDKRIKAIRHTHNYGESGLRNSLNKINGDYIAIAHSDDMWVPDKLEKQVKVLEEKKNIMACFTLVNVIDDNGNILNDSSHQYYRVFEQPNRTRFEWLNYFFNNGNCLCHPSVLIRKTAYTELGILSKGLHGFPDFYQWIKLCESADIYVLQEKLSCFRVHEDGSNTSGENIQNMNRIYTEEYLLIKEYFNLIGTGDLVKVFPEAEKYIVDKQINEQYALAQILLSFPKGAYQLLGIELLYQLFKNPESEQEIEKLYGYTRKKFNQDKQMNDVFHNIRESQCLNVSIYLSGRNGYYCMEALKKRIYIQNTGGFYVRFDLADFEDVENGKIRVDLDEGIFRKFRITKCICSGRNVHYKMVNGVKNEEWDEFYTFDPQYELDVDINGILEISGLTEELPWFDVDQHFGKIVMQRDRAKNECVKYQRNFLKLEEELRTIKSSRWWRMKDKFDNLIRR